MSRIVPIILVALLLVVVAPVHAAVVTELWSKDLASQVNAIDTDDNGNLTLIGTNDGIVTCYNASGELRWSKNYKTGGIRKVTLAPNVGKFVVQTWGQLAIYGDAWNSGKTIAEWDAYNYSYDNFKSKNNLSDVDISSNGGYWVVLADEYYSWINGTSNKSVVRSYDDYYNSGGLTNYTTLSKIVLDPNYDFIVVGNSSTVLKLYKYADNSANWYQNYTYRVKFTVTGSSSGSLKEYPVNITIYNTTGATSGSSVYVGSNNTAPDWDDIRIISSDGVTPVQQWYRQQWSNRVTYSVVPEVLAQSTSYSYYLYYGNSSAGRVSNATSKIIPEDAYTGGFSWDAYSNITNFDMESTPGTNWTCSAIPGPVSDCTYNSWHINGSTSRLSNAYSPDAAGADEYSYVYSNNSFTLLPNPNGSAYMWNITYDYRWSDSTNNPGGGSTNAYAYSYLYFNDTEASVTTLESHGVSGKGLSDTGNRSGFIRVNPGSHSIDIVSLTWAHGAYLGTPQTAGASSYADYLRLNATWTLAGAPSASFISSMNEKKIDLKYVHAKTVSGNIVAMDLPWNTPNLALSTSTYVYSIAVSETAGFGSTYSTSGIAAPVDIKSSDSGSYIVEGRGITMDIYDNTITLEGTLSSGNTIRSVDIATSSGLWVVGGGDDGKVYIFSKEGVSTWYTYYDSESVSTIQAVSLAPAGLYVSVGRATGNAILYLLTGTPTETTYQQDAYFVKNGNPYIGVNITVYESTVTPYIWNVKYLKLTDDRGLISFLASEGYYYRFVTTDNPTELDVVRAASASNAAFYLYITGTLPKYSYIINATGDNDTSHIQVVFTSTSGTADSVSFSIVNSTTGYIVTTQTYTSTTGFTYNVATGHSNWTYIVSGKIIYPGNDAIPWSMIIAPEAGVVNDIGSMIPYLDMYQRNALFLILLMVIAGLFSWAQSHRGALIVAAAAILFRMTGLITVRYEVILLAAGFAILASFVRGSRA